MAKIAMVGAGNLGQAQAAHLAMLGHEVRIYNRTAARIEEIVERGGILIHGVLEGLVELATASPRLSDVVPGCDAVIITVPASSHRAVVSACAPYLSDGMAIALHPGHTFGAFDAAEAVREAGKGHLDLTYCEIQTSLITSRLTGPAKVNASAIKRALPISVFPADHGFDRVEFLFEAYPTSIRAPDVLKTGLDNLNAPVHPSVVLSNLGRIDRGDDFLFYWDGFTPAVSKLVEAVDHERVEVARALGVEPITLLDFFDTAYDTVGPELWRRVQTNEAYREITAPKRIDTRLILEDLPTGLVPIASLGDALGVDTPVIDAQIALANTIFDTDFRVGARTVESLGLAGLGAAGIREYARSGKR
jgi:opine dehydrogenase